MIGDFVSVGVPVDHPFKNRQEEDAKVERDRPVFDVVKIMFNPFLQGGIPSPPIDLGPSCQSCHNLMAQHVFWDPMLELID